MQRHRSSLVARPHRQPWTTTPVKGTLDRRHRDDTPKKVAAALHCGDPQGLLVAYATEATNLGRCSSSTCRVRFSNTIGARRSISVCVDYHDAALTYEATSSDTDKVTASVTAHQLRGVGLRRYSGGTRATTPGMPTSTSRSQRGEGVVGEHPRRAHA